MKVCIDTKKLVDRFLNLTVADYLSTEERGKEFARMIIEVPASDLGLNIKKIYNLNYLELLSIIDNIDDDNFNGDFSNSNRKVNAQEFKYSILRLLVLMLEHASKTLIPARLFLPIRLFDFLDYVEETASIEAFKENVFEKMKCLQVAIRNTQEINSITLEDVVSIVKSAICRPWIPIESTMNEYFETIIIAYTVIGLVFIESYKLLYPGLIDVENVICKYS